MWSFGGEPLLWGRRHAQRQERCARGASGSAGGAGPTARKRGRHVSPTGESPLRLAPNIDQPTAAACASSHVLLYSYISRGAARRRTQTRYNHNGSHPCCSLY
ncbi:hypothetical protein EVAR_53046_1 [Eumeta japonica]|uniref:Uncharacterized protein n=1 Tax=Eumeta variegata TaxID=151549 RepID=A0A4C1YVC1_EUMVA|nr:hypothetical protein EVAR_53046_1 [Eumeta japonica]